MTDGRVELAHLRDPAAPKLSSDPRPGRQDQVTAIEVQPVFLIDRVWLPQERCICYQVVHRRL